MSGNFKFLFYPTFLLLAKISHGQYLTTINEN